MGTSKSCSTANSTKSTAPSEDRQSTPAAASATSPAASRTTHHTSAAASRTTRHTSAAESSFYSIPESTNNSTTSTAKPGKYLLVFSKKI